MQEKLMGKPELRSKLEERKKAPVTKAAVPTWLLCELSLGESVYVFVEL
jgi:hypothetical protein